MCLEQYRKELKSTTQLPKGVQNSLMKSIEKQLKPLLILLVTLAMASFCHTQETSCSNGIDDDGDGLIDQFDPDCQQSVDCFIQGEEEDFTIMAPEIHCSALLSAPSAYSSPIAGDVDGDGDVEIMVLNHLTHCVIVISGVDCSVEAEIQFPIPSFETKAGNIALGDVDHDGYIDMFVAHGRGGTPAQAIRRIEYDGTDYVTIWDTPNVATADRKHLDIIDINRDGSPELIPNGGFMVNSITGAVYPGALPTVEDRGKGLYAFTADADAGNNGNEGDVELILGVSIYRYDFIAGSWNLIRDIATHSATWGHKTKVSLADLDLDGDIDAVACNHDSNEYLAWDLQTTDIIAEASYAGSPGISRASIGNFDDDPEPEFVFIHYNTLEVIDDVVNSNAATLGFSNLWSLAIVDPSAHTQVTLFDFDADGKKEIVYRGETELYVYRGEADAFGNAQQIYNSGASTITSETGIEYPVIVDATGDGQANILAIGDSNSGLGEGLHIYKTSGSPWAPSRKIWNTQAYTATNVNDDGTIPTVMQENYLVYNDFMGQQGPYTPLPPDQIPTADLIMSVAVGNGVAGIIYDNCPDFGLAVQLCNQGDTPVGNNLNVEIYDGDPYVNAAAILVGNYELNTPIDTSECIIDTLFFTPNASTNHDFYFLINHNDPTGIYPLDATLVKRDHLECDYSNNVLSHSFSCNRPPVLIDDDALVCSEMTINIDVLDNDTDVDNNIDVSTLAIVTGPTNGTLTVVAGELQYTSNLGFAGSETITYSIGDTGFPVYTETATLEITVEASSNAGTSEIIELCTSESSIDLIDLLGGTPQIGGTWTTSGGTVHADQFDPSFELSQVLTYTIAGSVNCPSSSSTLDISVVSSPSAGTGGSIAFCDIDTPTNMLTLISGEGSSSGDWYNSSLTQIPPIFNPGVTPVGDFIYVIPGAGSCPSDTSFLSISIENILSPGTNSNLDICEDTGVQNLFSSLNGTPDGGGFWLDPNNSLHSGSLNPMTSPEGTYSYVINATSVCPQINADIEVGITPLLNPGEDRTLNLCRTDSPLDLFDELNGGPDTGGYWLDPNGNPHNGIINPSNALGGNYVYNLDMLAPCHAVSSKINVILSSPYDSGLDSSVELCNTGASEVMLGLLNGTPDVNGTWSYNGSNVSIVSFNPSTDLGGLYTYTVPTIGGCLQNSANVNITVNSASNAGEDSSIVVCNSLLNIDLNNYLSIDADLNGVWTDAGSAVVSSVIDVSTAGNSQYRYTITGATSCSNDFSDFSVTSELQLSAGTGNNFTLCESQSDLDLNNELSTGASNSGFWTSPDNSASTGLITPSSSLSGTYTYEVISPLSCANPTSEFEVTIESLPNSGESGGFAFFCNAFPGFDLLNSIPGSPQVDGYFMDPNGIEITDFSTSDLYTSGIYTYHANPENVCPETTSTLTVSIAEIGTPGADTAVTLCDNEVDLDLMSLLDGSPSSGGQWSDDNNVPIANVFTPTAPVTLIYMYSGGFPCPTLSSNLEITLSPMTTAGDDNLINSCEIDSNFDISELLSDDANPNGYWEHPDGSNLINLDIDPGVSLDGEYLYLTNPNTSCPQDTAVITVQTQNLPNAGEDGFLLVCSISDPVNLIGYLEGSPDPGGVWLAPDSSPVGQVFNPMSDTPGTYTYEVAGTLPCPTTAAQASVVVQNAPNAGDDLTENLCTTSNQVVLNSYLSPNSPQEYMWIDESGFEISNPIIEPLDSVDQAYRLIALGSGPCMNDTALYTFNITIPANIQAIVDMTYCTEDAPINMESCVEANYKMDVTFKDSNFNIISEVFDPSVQDSQQIWAIANSVSPCASDSIQLNIQVNSPANPGEDALINICSLDDSIDIFSQISGNPDPGGLLVWMNDTMSSMTFDPSLYSGSHFVEYIAPEVNPCTAYSSWMQIDIHQTPEPAFTIIDEDAELSNPLFYFENETDGTFNFTWDFDGLDTSFAYDAEYTFPEDISETYLVCLHADNLMGCEAYECQEVVVKDIFSHFIPNTFTPNGDGDNDIFYIRGRGIDIDYFELFIYSRNGDQVFHTTDLYEGWDGMWYGEEVPTDIYSFRLIMKAKDTSQRIEEMGHITVLR